MHESYSALLIVALAFMLAGFVKGMIGMGLPSVALGLLALVMTPAQGAAILIFPSVVTNTWQAFSGPDFLKLLRRLWSFLIGICVGVLSGFGLMTGPNADLAVTTLGFVLMVYALLGLFSVRFSVAPKHEKWLSPLIGLSTGVIGAATGVFSVPALPYLQALGLKRDELIQGLGIFFSIATFSLAVNLIRDGSLQFSVASASIIAFAAAVTGMALGTWVRKLASPEVFRVCFLIGMLLLGAHLASHLWL
jgi:uncharacterized membrane protein YfcA